MLVILDHAERIYPEVGQGEMASKLEDVLEGEWEVGRGDLGVNLLEIGAGGAEVVALGAQDVGENGVSGIQMSIS